MYCNYTYKILLDLGMSEPKVTSSAAKTASKTAQGHRERLRQRFLKDPVSLPDY